LRPVETFAIKTGFGFAEAVLSLANLDPEPDDIGGINAVAFADFHTGHGGIFASPLHNPVELPFAGITSKRINNLKIVTDKLIVDETHHPAKVEGGITAGIGIATLFNIERQNHNSLLG
jgi:hypothetical protein